MSSLFLTEGSLVGSQLRASFHPTLSRRDAPWTQASAAKRTVRPGVSSIARVWAVGRVWGTYTLKSLLLRIPAVAFVHAERAAALSREQYGFLC